MAFHPYPQLIPRVFNPGGSGPPRRLTTASTWPWVDHPASGPGHATHALFRLAFATPPPHGLSTPHATDSQAHSSKGTPSPHKAPTAYRHPVSGTISLPSRGTFHHSLTVLCTIGHWVVFRLTRWSWQIHTRFHEPRTTRAPTPRTRTRVHLPGSHGLRPAIPDDSAPHARTRPPPAEDEQVSPTTPHTQHPPAITRARFSHHPLSLATTHGISSPTGTEMFHFPAFPPPPYEFKRW